MESFLATQYKDWSVYGVPAFEDNYLWAIVHQPYNQCLLVDPGCAHSINRFLKKTRSHVNGILVTHHHQDHIGGISELIKQQETTTSAANKTPVYAPNNAHIPYVSHQVSQPGLIHELGLSIQVLNVPGHTQDHKAYFIELDVNTHWLFCGDTLFAGGCGRLLGGTPEQMYESLQKLKQLPEDTLVFCAHEYTVNNLLFEKSYAPNCLSIQERLHQAQHIRAQNLPTIPSTIGQEKQTNLFLLASNTEAFKAIRTAKDHF